MSKSIRFALIDTALYYVAIIILTITLIMERSADDSEYISAQAGMFEPGFLVHLLTYAVLFYGLKVFLLSVIYRSDSRLNFSFEGTPLRYAYIVFYVGTLSLFMYFDWMSLQVVYTTLTAENTVQGLETWVALLSQVCIFVVSSVVAIILTLINGSILKRRRP